MAIKILVGLLAALLVTGAGVYYASPDTLDHLFASGDRSASPCCSAKVKTLSPCCSLSAENQAATVDPSDALAACTGGHALVAGKSSKCSATGLAACTGGPVLAVSAKTATPNCCAE